MARPLKRGLDYFPMDTTLDFKYSLLKAKYKLEGIGFIDSLYRTIYREGYYVKLDEDNLLMLSSDFGLDETKFNELLLFCIGKDFFDKDMWDKHKILTSNGIQRRYFHKTVRRIDKNYEFLLPETQLMLSQTPIIDDNKYTKKNKVKEIKVKEIKEEKNEVLSHWNTFAKDNGLSTILSLSQKRMKGINARMKETQFDLHKIFEQIEKSDFLRGENERGWKVDFDFVFCSANNYLKIMEGKYANNKGSVNKPNYVSPEEITDGLKQAFSKSRAAT